MNLRIIPSPEPGAGPENYDHHVVRHDEYAPSTYAKEYRRLANLAIDPERRKELLGLAEMFE